MPTINVRDTSPINPKLHIYQQRGPSGNPVPLAHMRRGRVTVYHAHDAFARLQRLYRRAYVGQAGIPLLLGLGRSSTAAVPDPRLRRAYSISHSCFIGQLMILPDPMRAQVFAELVAFVTSSKSFDGLETAFLTGLCTFKRDASGLFTQAVALWASFGPRGTKCSGVFADVHSGRVVTLSASSINAVGPGGRLHSIFSTENPVAALINLNDGSELMDGPTCEQSITAGFATIGAIAGAIAGGAVGSATMGGPWGTSAGAVGGGLAGASGGKDAGDAYGPVICGWLDSGTGTGTETQDQQPQQDGTMTNSSNQGAWGSYMGSQPGGSGGVGPTGPSDGGGTGSSGGGGGNGSGSGGDGTGGDGDGTGTGHTDFPNPEDYPNPDDPHGGLIATGTLVDAVGLSALMKASAGIVTAFALPQMGLANNQLTIASVGRSTHAPQIGLLNVQLRPGLSIGLAPVVQAGVSVATPG